MPQFAAVPHCLLSKESPFENPNDFMVYMRLYGVSFGWGRNTCDMGLGELVKFTRLCKNSVKKSVERLQKQGWIKKIEEYEPGNISRKWRVMSPWEKGLTPEPTHLPKDGSSEESSDGEQGVTESENDRVTNSPGQPLTLRGSKNDLPAGSKSDLYLKEKETKKSLKSSLSKNATQIADGLRAYFSDVRPQRKRESEYRAFEEIRRDFQDEDIEAALSYIKEHGLPGGDPCHSPMAYLASAMNDVLGIVKSIQEKDRKRIENVARLEAQKRLAAEAEARDREEWDRHEQAFNHTFCGEERQQEVIGEMCRKHRYFTTKGIAARTFAIGAWWQTLNEYERLEAAG